MPEEITIYLVSEEPDKDSGFYFYKVVINGKVYEGWEANEVEALKTAQELDRQDELVGEED